MQINNLRDRWIQDGRLTSTARELFYLGGRDIEEMPLSDAVAITQEWLNETDSSRWQVHRAEQSFLMEVLQCATELGMHEPWRREEDVPAADMVVVLPGDYRSMFAAMWYAINEMRGVNLLLMTSSLRRATEEELDILGNHKLIPTPSFMATEASMAQLALTKAVFEESTQMRAVLAVGTPNGEPATFDEVISKVLDTFESGGEITFALNQPEIHKAAKVQRVLELNGFEGVANYIASSPVFITGDSNPTIDVKYINSLLDEGCRVIEELFKLERVTAA